MSTIFGENIHSYVKNWDEVETTKFQGFDVNSWAKDCFDSSFVMHYKGGDKTVDNKGVIHFTKDGCIILNGVIYSGAQCLNVVYEAYTGNKLNTAGEAEDFMMRHADDPHLAFVFFHIYPYDDIVGNQISDSLSIGTGLFITSGRTATGGLFYQHYFWAGTHYYRVVAAEALEASAWIEIQDISSIRYNESEHKIELHGIKNLSTSIKNPAAFVGNTASSVIIPLADSSKDGLCPSGIPTQVNNNTKYINELKTSVISDLTDKVNKAVDRSIYNFDNIINGGANTLKPLSELYNYNGANDSSITTELQNIENCEINWYADDRKFFLNLGQYQWPVTEVIIKNTNPDWDIWNRWYSMYGKPVIYGNTDNYQYNLYRETHGFNDQSKNWRNAANNIYVICSEGDNQHNNIESLSYILLDETGIQNKLDWLAEKVTQEPSSQPSIDLTPYVKKSEFDELVNNWDSSNRVRAYIDSVMDYIYRDSTNSLESHILPGIRNNFTSYVTKQQLVNQSYIKKTDAVKSFTSYQYISNQSYITPTKLNTTLNDYTLNSNFNVLQSKVGLNTTSISDLYNSYNSLYSSFITLQNSYNSLYNTVAYNISYHNSMIEYLIGLHNSSGTVVTPAPVTDAPVTDAPVTSAPAIDSITLKLSDYNNKKNILWDSSYIRECVTVHINNDLINSVGSTYNNDTIQINNVSFIGTRSYMFDLTLVSNVVVFGSLTKEQALSQSHGYKLIWTGGLSTTTMGEPPSQSCPSTNINDCPYMLEGAFGSTLTAYRGTNGPYEIFGRYVNGTTTIPGVGSAYYTAKFRYLYPYLTKLGDYTFSYFEYPNDYVINDDSDKTKRAVTPGKWYNVTDSVSVMLDSSWMYNNKYFVKYTVTIDKSAAVKFNSGDYKMQVGLHVCSPQIFRTDDLTIK